MTIERPLALLALSFVAAAAVSAPGSAVGARQDDAAHVPSQDLRAGGNERMRYFLIGWDEEREAPEDGYRLLLVMPGGTGSADFQAFVKRIHDNVLDERYVVAQLVAPAWSDEQAEKNVWPTKKSPADGMEFTTEEFLAAVVEDVDERLEIDPAYVFTLAWSSSGQAAYSYSLTDDARVTGTFVAMAVFKPDFLPSLKAAKGHAYYLLHSPEDFIPISHAEAARDQLGKRKAEVELATYSGGHGWQGDVYGNMRAGIRWLEEHHAKPAKPRKRK